MFCGFYMPIIASNDILNTTDHAMFLQSLNLLKIDIYDCTKYGIEQYGYSEGNPWAAYWIDRGRYDELFAIMAFANTSLYLGSFVWQNHVEKIHASNSWKKLQLIKLIKFLRKYYLTIWGVTEIYAISTWKNTTANFEYYISF